MADAPIRWGILATGRIARSFASDLALLPDARLAAVGARSLASAEAFAAELGPAFGPVGVRAHSSYAGLVADPEVDVVYVASPHALHHAHVTLALESGKSVLCEKALTLDASQARELVALAGQKGLFLMEAMWMACHPLVRDLVERTASGEFGTPLQLVADLGWRVERPPTDRLLDPALGGGALLDLGVYPLTLADLFLGEPTEQRVTGALSPSGVDLNVAISASYASGAVAALTASMTAHTPRSAWLATDAGRLEIPAPFHHPSRARWYAHNSATGHPVDPVGLLPREPVIGTGLGNEAAEVMRCLRAGLTESPLVPHAQTLRVLDQLDDLRHQLGVRYPHEL